MIRYESGGLQLNETFGLQIPTIQADQAVWYNVKVPTKDSFLIYGIKTFQSRKPLPDP